MQSLTLKHLYIAYPDMLLPAVNDLSLRIGKGDIIELSGPSGSGKGSVLKAIAGLTDYQGSILWDDGKELNEVPVKERDFTFASYDSPLFLRKTVYEHLEYGLKLRKIPASEREKRIADVAAEFEISDILGKKVKQLDTFQLRMVILSRAFVRDSGLYLLNDLSKGLPNQCSIRILEKMRHALHVRGATAILATDEFSKTFAPDVWIMREGSAVQRGCKEALAERPANLFVALFTADEGLMVLPAVLSLENGGSVRLCGSFGQDAASEHSSAAQEETAFADDRSPDPKLPDTVHIQMARGASSLKQAWQAGSAAVTAQLLQKHCVLSECENHFDAMRANAVPTHAGREMHVKADATERLETEAEDTSTQRLDELSAVNIAIDPKDMRVALGGLEADVLEIRKIQQPEFSSLPNGKNLPHYLILMRRDGLRGYLTMYGREAPKFSVSDRIFIQATRYRVFLAEGGNAMVADIRSYA